MQHLFGLHSSLRGRRKEGKEVRKEGRKGGRVEVKSLSEACWRWRGLKWVGALRWWISVRYTVHIFSHLHTHVSSFSFTTCSHKLLVKNPIKMCQTWLMLTVIKTLIYHITPILCLLHRFIFPLLQYLTHLQLKWMKTFKIWNFKSWEFSSWGGHTSCFHPVFWL